MIVKIDINGQKYEHVLMSENLKMTKKEPEMTKKEPEMTKNDISTFSEKEVKTYKKENPKIQKSKNPKIQKNKYEYPKHITQYLGSKKNYSFDYRIPTVLTIGLGLYYFNK